MSVGESSEPLPGLAGSGVAALVSARFEAKYRIGRDVAATLREQLAARLTPHHYSVPPGVVASASLRHITTTLYFDTARRDLCRAAAHVPVHRKVRARLYRDEPAPAPAAEPLIWIELKERDGVCSRKRRAAVDRHEAQRWLAALALEDPTVTGTASSSLLAELAELRLALGAPLLPSCVVRYRRDAFHDACGTLRVTLDGHVHAYAAPRSPFDPGALEPEALGAPRHREPDCVLEIKSTREPPAWLAALLAAHGARPTDYSKLVMASLAVHGPL